MLTFTDSISELSGEKFELLLKLTKDSFRIQEKNEYDYLLIFILKYRIPLFFQASELPLYFLKAYDHIGYCPQFDAIIGEMTGQETLQMFARLRGVRECDVMQMIDSVIHAVALDKYRNNLIKTYRLALI